LAELRDVKIILKHYENLNMSSDYFMKNKTDKLYSIHLRFINYVPAAILRHSPIL